MEIAIHVIIMMMGGYWVQQGLSVYGFWKNNIPGSGFLPVLFGLIVLCLTVVSLIGVIKQRHTTRIVALGESNPEATTAQNRVTFKGLIASPRIRPLIPSVYTLLAILLMVIVGVVPAMFLTAFVWLFWYSKIALGKSLFISAMVSLFVFLVFVLWLGIPFPRGIFGI